MLMGNILSIINSPDSSDMKVPDSETSPMINMDMSTVDDLDFIAAELILTTNTEHLNSLIENAVDGSNRSEVLANKISEAIQDDIAVNKLSRIMESEPITTETSRHEVSAFYLNIARVLVAISLAIQPNNKDLVATDDSDNILSPNFSISHLSFCGSRIKRFAKTETNDDNTDEMEVAEMTTLGNHYGIPELYDLYFDTEYDQETGSFLGMSDDTKSVFNRDLARFYHAFSGETVVPDNIKRFGDIPLHENKDRVEDVPEPSTPLFVCKFGDNDDVDCDPLFTSLEDDNNDPKKVTLKSNLLSQFAEHLQKMISSVMTKRKILVELVNKMFVFGTHTVDGERKRRPRVRPYLTIEDVEKIASDAHQTIVDMSLQCEIDNHLGNEIFTALHAIQTLESSKNQIRTMEQDLDLLVYA